MAHLHRRGLSINFTNIRGLKSNFASVEFHLSNSNPNLLLLSETQMAKNSPSNSFNVSNYNLFHNFRLKGGVCAYVNMKIPFGLCPYVTTYTPLPGTPRWIFMDLSGVISN